jgi:hypothetical protein
MMNTNERETDVATATGKTASTARDCWSPAEEADKLGISVGHLRELIKRHAPPVMQAGRRVLFDPRAHDELKEAMRQCYAGLRSLHATVQTLSTCMAPSGASAYSRLLALTDPNCPKRRSGPKGKGAAAQPIG